MTAAEFVNWVNKNAVRVTHYEKGGDGSNGGCDCIGLIIGAWRMAGQSWPWTHGSNYAARYLTANLGADQALKLGDLVYKARPPGAAGYDLPERYKDGPDLLDYYHVGVVTCAEPLQITHCTTVDGGIKRDTTRGKWQYSGQFSKVDYESGGIMVKKIVWTANGKPLNLRKSFSTSSTIIAKMPVGSEVNVIDYPNDTWANVEYKDKIGYCVTEYLRDPDAEPENKQEINNIIEQMQLQLYQMQTTLDKLKAVNGE